MRALCDGNVLRSAFSERPAPVRQDTLIHCSGICKTDGISQADHIVGLIGFDGGHRAHKLHAAAPLYLKSVSAGSEIIDYKSIGVPGLHVHITQKIIVVRNQAPGTVFHRR